VEGGYKQSLQHRHFYCNTQRIVFTVNLQRQDKTQSSSCCYVCSEGIRLPTQQLGLDQRRWLHRQPRQIQTTSREWIFWRHQGWYGDWRPAESDRWSGSTGGTAPPPRYGSWHRRSCRGWSWWSNSRRRRSLSQTACRGSSEPSLGPPHACDVITTDES